MRITHPMTGQTADVSDDSYEFVWKAREWEPAPEPDEEPAAEDASPPDPDQSGSGAEDINAAPPSALPATTSRSARKTATTQVDGTDTSTEEPTA